MARKPVQAAAAPPPPPARKIRINIRKLLLGISVFALVAAIIPGMVMVSIVGMMPSLVALLLDRTQQKYKALCVGGMNWCGVFPYVLDLFTTARSFEAAKAVMTSPLAYLAMWGCAVFGHVLFMVIPPVVSTFLTVMAQRKIAQLRSTQRRLIEEWGDDVARGGKP